MAKTWAAKVRFNRGGSGSKSGWVNVFHFSSDNAIDSDMIATEVQPLVDAIRRCTLDSVQIVSVTISDPAKRAAGYDPALVRTIPIGQNGQKLTGAEHAQIKEVVVKLSANAGSGRPGHVSLRMATYVSEVFAGADGEPAATGEPAGVADTVAALNGAITAGLKLHVYSKRKSGAITDKAITSYVYQSAGYRTARRHKKKPMAKTASGLIQNTRESAQSLLSNIANATTIADKLGAPALAAVKNALTALEAPVSELLPALDAAALL